MAGYSGTPLVKKLGIKPDSKVGLIQPPRGFDGAFEDLPDGAKLYVDPRGSAADLDVIVLFAANLSALRKQLEPTARRLNAHGGGLWIAWPKKSSGVKTDLTENVIRDLILPSGLVDNKVCAIDETWSGLRFVVRLKDRPLKAKR